MERISRAGLLDNMFGAIDHVTPGAAVPVIVAREIENARAFHIQGHVVVIGELIEKVAGVGAAISTGAIVRAAHVSARAEALQWPFFPLAVGIKADWNHRRLVG